MAGTAMTRGTGVSPVTACIVIAASESEFPEGMKRCLSLGLFSLALTAWYSCDWRAKHEAKSNDAPAVSAPPNLRIAPTTPLTSPDQIEAAFRLGPDRRCLWAVAELHRLLTGTEKAPTEASF